jgi:NADH:ubiquinone oxidoreductase subunit F (NADH-binding)/nucleotide-binding universal stress UspA family protein
MPLVSRVLDKRPVRTLGEYIEMGGGIAARSVREAPPEQVVGLLRSSGLRGRGGAGFPTGVKWETVAASRSSRDVTTVVVNAAEGEPGTFKDRALLRTNPYRVLEGAIIAATTMSSDQIRIGIKATFDREIHRLTIAIAEMRDAGWLRNLDVQLVLGPSSYLFGEETGLLEVIEGRQPFPRVTPPYRRGLQADDTRSAGGVSLATVGGNEGPPALVDNVETLANVPLIVERGAEWFRELGTERSPGTIICTVSGATRRSAVGEVAMGSTLRDVIELVGWGPRRGRDVRIVLAGTANALIPSDRLDTPLTYEAMQDAGSGLGSAGFIVFDETTEPAAVAAGVARFLSVESCGQCEHCKGDGLDIAEQLRRSQNATLTSSDIKALRRRIDTVAAGARCNLARQQSAVAESLLAVFPTSLGPRQRGVVASAVEPVMIAPIKDLVGGRASLDTRQLSKQPDWSYGDHDSGATPAARLGNTPVRIASRTRTPTWSEWAPSVSTELPLELIDDAHNDIEALIDRAMAGGDDRLDDRVDDVVIAIRTHVDVTGRVLFPMLRRVGDDAGDRLADAAEAQEQTLLRLVDEIQQSSDIRSGLQDIGVALHDHAAIGDEIVALLRAELDPVERSSLADGLAAARSTSTVSRLYRSASRSRAHASPPLRQPHDRDRDPAARLAASPEVRDDDAPHAAAHPIVEQEHRVVPVVPAAEAVSDLPATPAPSRDKRTALRSILVGVDGSPAATAALEWAGRLAALVGAEVLVANIFEPDQAEVSPESFQKLVAEAEQRLREEWSAPLRGANIPHRYLQLTGTPDRLLAAADAEGADLLVVGTRGAGRHAGLHLGSLAHHLAHYTRGPLAIVPLTGAAASIDRIVIGVDGSPGSTAAVTWCADITAATSAKVTAVCAFDPHPRWMFGDLAGAWRSTAEQAITTEWIAPLRARGVSVRTRIIEGNHPRAALEKAATEDGAGLFVVGCRGLSEIGGMRLGGLPVQLVHHTHLPVVLVPPSDRSPALPVG